MLVFPVECKTLTRRNLSMKLSINSNNKTDEPIGCLWVYSKHEDLPFGFKSNTDFGNVEVPEDFHGLLIPVCKIVVAITNAYKIFSFHYEFIPLSHTVAPTFIPCVSHPNPIPKRSSLSYIYPSVTVHPPCPFTSNMLLVTWHYPSLIRFSDHLNPVYEILYVFFALLFFVFSQKSFSVLIILLNFSILFSIWLYNS